MCFFTVFAVQLCVFSKNFLNDFAKTINCLKTNDFGNFPNTEIIDLDSLRLAY